jgi:hypothetical protein
MEKTGGSNVDEIPEVRAQDVLKEGYLFKQSRFLKEWRKYVDKI